MVYECFYCPINFGPFPLKKFKPSALRDKKLNLNGYNILKEKILSHIVNDYPEMVIAESIFNESGFCLISDFEPISNIDIASVKALANVQGQLKALAYIEIMNLAADFTKSKPLFINHKIYQEFSKNILK